MADTPDLDACERASTDAGPDYCKPCSDRLGDWVQWDDHRFVVRDLVFVRGEVERLRAERDRLVEGITDTVAAMDDVPNVNFIRQRLRALLKPLSDDQEG